MSEPTPAPVIEWSERYAVGIRAIDGQHREMLELVNRLIEGLHAGREQGELVETLRQLVRATEHNIATEEQLMREYGLEPERHRAEHHRLLESVRSFHRRLEPGAIAENSRFLREWLIGHIEQDDRPFAAQLRERGAR